MSLGLGVAALWVMACEYLSLGLCMSNHVYFGQHLHSLEFLIHMFISGIWKTRKSGIWNLESGTGTGTGIGEINECFKSGSMIHIKTPPPFSAFLARWMTIHRPLLRKGTST